MKVPPLICLAAAFLAIFCAGPAFAHRLNVFAWPENGKVVVECNFGKSSPARGAQISVRRLAGPEELLSGSTNDRGRFEFPIPEDIGPGLLIVANAGEGHRNQWQMPAADFAGLAGSSASPEKTDGEKEATREAGQKSEEGRENVRSPGAADAHMDDNAPLTPAQARIIVNMALENEMASIRRMLAELQSPGPNLRDIIGGIGWIIGLVGIFLYCKSRGR